MIFCFWRHTALASVVFERAVKGVLFKTGQGPISGCEPVVMGHCKFSLSSTLKRKAYLLPTWCLYYYLSVLFGSDRTRPASQEPSSQQPPLAWFNAHNDGYTEDYFTYSHTIASTLPYLVPNTHCLKVGDYISCPSDCHATVAMADLIFCRRVRKSRIVSNLHTKRKQIGFLVLNTHFFLVMHFNKKAVE